MRTSAPSTRGQALVETSLGLIVFITILIFGIYFGELTTLQMKVTEAAASATWDSTAGQMHNFSYNYDQVNGTVANAATDADSRYVDFDGRMGVDTGSLTQVFTSARNLRVSCRVGGEFPRYENPADNVVFNAAGVFEDNGGMSCNASAEVAAVGASDWGTFLEGGDGFFQAAHKDSAALTGGMRVCAVGRPNGFNGPCDGRMAMMIDDWGLAGGDESRSCPILPVWGGNVPCINHNMWNAPFRVYQWNSLWRRSTNNADYDLVRRVYGATPPPWLFRHPGGFPVMPFTPTSFFMNYMGEEGLFRGALAFAGDGSSRMWQTTPFEFVPTYAAAYATGSGCYLGKDCNNSTANQP